MITIIFQLVTQAYWEKKSKLLWIHEKLKRKHAAGVKYANRCQVIGLGLFLLAKKKHVTDWLKKNTESSH